MWMYLALECISMDLMQMYIQVLEWYTQKIKVRKIQSFIWSDFFVLNVKMHKKKYLSRCQNKDDVKTIFILSNGNSEFDDVDN